jgi:hypothetical protein
MFAAQQQQRQQMFQVCTSIWFYSM